jgi:hypothetical protein
VYAKFVTSELKPLSPLTDLTDAFFLEHWDDVASKKSILENRQRELKMVANGRFMRGEMIAAAGSELYSTQASRTNYHIEDVVGIIPQDDLFEVLVVNKARLDRYIKERPDLKSALSKIAKVSYNAPVFKTRAAKVVEDEDGVTDQDASAA